MMTPIPSLNQAYSLIIHEEGQWTHLNVTSQLSYLRPQYEDIESFALAFSTTSQNITSLKQKHALSSQGRGTIGHICCSKFYKGKHQPYLGMKRNSSLQCNFCHIRGYTKDQYYKLIGYPSDFKFTRNAEKEQHRFRGGNYNGLV